MTPEARQVEDRAIEDLLPSPRNARIRSKKQIGQIARSIEGFGFTNPVLISEQDEILAGHGRVEAARLLGLESVPTLRITHLTAAQRRAYILADNKLALNAGWDPELLALELAELRDLEIDLAVTGFSLPEIELVLDSRPTPIKAGVDALPCAEPCPPISRFCDLWVMGAHRLLCGDPTVTGAHQALLGEQRAAMVFAGQNHSSTAARAWRPSSSM